MDVLRNVIRKIHIHSGQVVTHDRLKYVVWYLLPVVAIVACVAIFFSYVLANNSNATQKQISSSEDGFVVRADYLGDQNWNFTVDGNFSNQCIHSDVVVEQLETDPEDVTVRLVSYRPTDETLCAQKIQEVSHNGEFIASRDASITLKIDERESKESPTGLKLKNL